MGRKRIDQLGSLQRAVMEVLWERGEATVQETVDSLPADPRPAYTTVLSVLQKLEKAGWTRHRSEGRKHIYSACRTRVEEGVSALRKFIDGVFAGDPRLLFQHLIDDDRLSEGELADLQEMIDSRRKEDTND